MKKLITSMLLAFIGIFAYAQSTEISELIAGQTTLNLVAGTEYTLNAEAVLSTDVVTVNGNGATIKVGEAGKFSVQKGIILNKVILDASATSKAVIELSATPDASLATYTIEGEETTFKYEGASQKVYEAERVEINNSTFITNNSVIRPGAAWALRNLTIDNSIIEVKNKSGKAIINMEENSGNSIQNITVKNSTIYADDAATDMRFIRYSNASNAQSQKVWGTDDNNASLTLTSNTFVGVCGNKEFANNYVNNKLYQFTFKNNAFINTWRISKLGTNNTRNFEQADNVIMGGTNAVDGTDANWFTAVEDLGAVWNFTEGAPAATDMAAMGAAFGLYEDYKSYGDPRWVTYAKVEPTEISEMIVGKKTLNLKADKEYTLNAAAVLNATDIVAINANGATIKVGAEGQFVAQKGIIIDCAVIDASAATKALILMEKDPAKIDASLSTFTAEISHEATQEDIDAGNATEIGEKVIDQAAASKYEGGSQKMNESEMVKIMNSTIKSLPQALVTGIDGLWAFDEITIFNSIVNFNTSSISGQNSAIDGGSVKVLNISGSTIYNTAANTASYFVRLKNASNAGKVWGSNPKETHKFTIENSTLVNALGSKDFANNWFSNGNFTVVLDHNIFYNVYRLKNKFIGNCSFDKENTPAANIFDHSEGFTLDSQESQIATLAETGIVAPTAETGFEFADLGACFGVYEDYGLFGDMRWAGYPKVEPTEISEMIVGKNALSLKAGKEYTLNAEAVLSTDVVTINGNGATVKVGEAGKFSVQKGIVLDNVVLDGTATANAIVELSANPDASLATYTDAIGTEGEEGYVPASMKYANASWKGYEAQEITIKNSTIITNNSIIRPAKAWAIRALNIDNTIVEVKYKSGKAIINMEENGAGVIQDINIKNSTFYADDAATEMRFHRYASQLDPWRVWGYEGEDKNVTKDTWTLENNTFVGVCGNKEFSNNMKNTNATEFTFKNNAFINTWRINKLGGNCKRNFEQADNVIMGGTNAVDGTDANWFTAVDDLGAVWNFETAPAATDKDAMGAAFGLYESYKTFGDPRWAEYAKEEPVEMVLSNNELNDYTSLGGPLMWTGRDADGNNYTIAFNADGSFNTEYTAVMTPDMSEFTAVSGEGSIKENEDKSKSLDVTITFNEVGTYHITGTIAAPVPCPYALPKVTATTESITVEFELTDAVEGLSNPQLDATIVVKKGEMEYTAGFDEIDIVDGKVVQTINNGIFSAGFEGLKLEEGDEIEIIIPETTLWHNTSGSWEKAYTGEIEGSVKVTVIPATGISNISAAAAEGPAYNLAGQRVNASAKGVVISNGKKMLKK